MFKNNKTRILLIIMVALFSLTFCLGVFANPNFNIYDFCMNLATEIIGYVIVLLIVESYIKEKQK